MISEDHFRKFDPAQLRPEKRGWLELLRPARPPSEAELFSSAVLLVGLFTYLLYNFATTCAAYWGAA